MGNKIMKISIVIILLVLVLICVTLVTILSSFDAKFSILCYFMGDEMAYDYIIHNDPDNIKALKGRAALNSLKALTDRVAGDKALSDYNKILTILPDDVDTLHERINFFWAKYLRVKFSTDDIIKTYISELIDNCTKLDSLGEADYITYYIRSAALFEKGQFEKAIKDLSRCVNLQPDNPEPYSLRSEVYFCSDEYSKAVEDIMKAHKLDPDTYRDIPHAWLARWTEIHHARKDLKKLERSYTKMIENNPGISDFYTDRAWNYIEMEQYDKAIKDYSKVIELETWNASALARRGGFGYRLKGDLKRALADCNKAIELNPEDSIPYFFRALVYLDMKRREDAIPDLLMATEIDLEWDEPITLLGNIYMDMKDYDKALSYYDKALGMRTHIGLLYLKARALDAAGRNEEAVRVYRGYVKFYNSPYIFGWDEDNMRYAKDRIKALEAGNPV